MQSTLIELALLDLYTANSGCEFRVHFTESGVCLCAYGLMGMDFLYLVHGRTSSQAFFAAAHVRHAPEIRERPR